MTEPLAQVVSTGNAADAKAPASRPDYRAHAVDRTGRLPAYVEVEAEDDAQAVALTRELAAFYPVELWHGTRCLGRFTPEDDAGSGPPPRRDLPVVKGLLTESNLIVV